MNDAREAIERVGSRFDPPSYGFEDLAGRRNRTRTRRRITAGALALTFSVGALLLAVRAFPASTPGPPSKVKVLAKWPTTSAVTPDAAAASEPSCPAPTGDGPPQVVLSSTSGPAGSSVDASGLFWTGQLWLQLWWNAGEAPGEVAPPPWPPTGPDLRFAPAGRGPVAELTSVAGPSTTGNCSFQTRFNVPNVEPGTYQVQWVFGTANPPHGETGYALLTSPLTFEVIG